MSFFHPNFLGKKIKIFSTLTSQLKPKKGSSRTWSPTLTTRCFSASGELRQNQHFPLSGSTNGEKNFKNKKKFQKKFGKKRKKNFEKILEKISKKIWKKTKKWTKKSFPAKCVEDATYAVRFDSDWVRSVCWARGPEIFPSVCFRRPGGLRSCRRNTDWPWYPPPFPSWKRWLSVHTDTEYSCRVVSAVLERKFSTSARYWRRTETAKNIPQFINQSINQPNKAMVFNQSINQSNEIIVFNQSINGDNRFNQSINWTVLLLNEWNNDQFFMEISKTRYSVL